MGNALHGALVVELQRRLQRQGAHAVGRTGRQQAAPGPDAQVQPQDTARHSLHRGGIGGAVRRDLRGFRCGYGGGFGRGFCRRHGRGSGDHPRIQRGFHQEFSAILRSGRPAHIVGADAAIGIFQVFPAILLHHIRNVNRGLAFLGRGFIVIVIVAGRLRSGNRRRLGQSGVFSASGPRAGMVGIAVILFGLVDLAGLLDLVLDRLHIGLVLHLFLNRQSHGLRGHKAFPLFHGNAVFPNIHLLDEQGSGFRVQRIGAGLAGFRGELDLKILPQNRQTAFRIHHGNAHALLNSGGFDLQLNRCRGGFRCGCGFRFTCYRLRRRLTHTHRNRRTVVGCIHRGERNAGAAAHGYRQRTAQSHQSLAQRHAGKLAARKIAGKIPFVHS